MGVKGHRKKHLNDEPTILNDVNSIIEDAKKKGLVKDYEVNIEEIVKNNGIILMKDPEMDASMSGILSKDKKKNQWVITVNAKHHIRRQRYTIAHEFAHYCLHKDERGSFVDETIYFRKANDTPIEFKADEFAAELLMPTELFKKAIDIDKIKKITDLADRFNVSRIAIEKRAKNLNYKFKSHEE